MKNEAKQKQRERESDDQSEIESKEDLDDSSGVAEAVAGDVVSEDEVVPRRRDSVDIRLYPHFLAGDSGLNRNPSPRENEEEEKNGVYRKKKKKKRLNREREREREIFESRRLRKIRVILG